MGWFLQWFYTFVLEFLGGLLSTIYSSVTFVFDDPVIKSFFAFWQTMGGLIYAVSILIGLFALFEKAIEKEFPNFYTFGKNIMISTIMLVSTPVIIYVFKSSMNILTLVLKAINSNYSTPNIILATKMPEGVSSGVMLMLVIILLIGALMTFFGSLKRMGSMIVYIVTIYWLIPGVMQGNYSGLIQWVKQVLAVILIQFIQVSMFSIAVVKGQNMLVSGDLNASLTTMMLLSSLSIVPTVINGLFQGATGGKGGAMGFMMSAAQMGFFAMVGRGKAPIPTPAT